MNELETDLIALAPPTIDSLFANKESACVFNTLTVDIHFANSG